MQKNFELSIDKRAPELLPYRQGTVHTGFALADMAELVDALDLGSCGAIHVGSTPTICTKPPQAAPAAVLYSFHARLCWAFLILS